MMEVVEVEVTAREAAAAVEVTRVGASAGNVETINNPVVEEAVDVADAVVGVDMVEELAMATLIEDMEEEGVAAVTVMEAAMDTMEVMGPGVTTETMGDIE